MIAEFRGENYFLSNFYPTAVTYDGLTYRNTEAAFQASKTTDLEKRIKFTKMNPSAAKQAGRRIVLRRDWESIKENIMYEICKAKFVQNLRLKEQLLATKDEYLEEGNTWGDHEWGVSGGYGENKLGKILMRIRIELSPETAN